MTVALPPGFEAVDGAPDPFAAAVACAGAEPGRVYWDLVAGVCRVAVVLAPDRAVSEESLEELMVLVAHDALATLAPPQAPVEVVLPETLLVNGGRVGRVRTVVGPGAVADGGSAPVTGPAGVPSWAMGGVELALSAEGAEPGHAPNATSLAEEGFGAVTAEELIEQVCRHLLVWVDTWKHQGADAVSMAVARRMKTLEDLEERT